MDFELNDDQQALRDAARELLDGRSSSAQVRATFEAEAPWDAELWKAMVDQGWTGIAVAEDAGGVGLGWVEVAVLLEEVGAHVAPAPILQQIVALDALTATPWAEPLLAGDVIACVAASGAREVVPYAPSAEVAVCVRGNELVAFVPSSAREPAMDVTREVGWLDPSAATDVTVLGGVDTVSAFVDRGAMAYAAELLGGAQRLLDLSVEYAKDRVQFDKPIGSFQAVKHRLADMLVDVEGMRSAVYYAAWCIAPRSSGSVGRGINGEGVVLRRIEARGRIGAPGARRHRLHVGARRASLPQARTARPTRVRRRGRPSHASH